MRKYFLSCDWGTTSFRLRLADAADGAAAAEIKSAEGIAIIFDRWRESGKPETERAGFYLKIIGERIVELEKVAGFAFDNVPLAISGMASSSIGLTELPYAKTPFNINGNNLTSRLIKGDKTFGHNVLLISGARTDRDVVRGEETQLIGCISPGAIAENELFIFPGTHSKHIVVKQNEVTDIKTYMTGELFALLSQKSILKNSVNESSFIENLFEQGLSDAQSLNLLNSVFKVRTNDLLGIYSGKENYNYLSGLLIGAELKDLESSTAETINLVCGNELEVFYRLGLQTLVKGRNIKVFSKQQAEEAVIKGQLKIANSLNFLE